MKWSFFRSAVFGAVGCLAVVSTAQAQHPNDPPEVTECDRLASYEFDVTRLSEHVDFSEIDTDSAIAACRSALQNFPDSPRINWQLGRSIYAAQNDGSFRYTQIPSEVLSLFLSASAQGHTATNRMLLIHVFQDFWNLPESERRGNLRRNQEILLRIRKYSIRYVLSNNMTEIVKLLSEDGRGTHEAENLRNSAILFQTGLGDLPRDNKKAALLFAHAAAFGDKESFDRMYSLLEAENDPLSGGVENLFKGYVMLASLDECNLRVSPQANTFVENEIQKIMETGFPEKTADLLWERVVREMRNLVMIGICSSIAAGWQMIEITAELDAQSTRSVPPRPR